MLGRLTVRPSMLTSRRRWKPTRVSPEMQRGLAQPQRPLNLALTARGRLGTRSIRLIRRCRPLVLRSWAASHADLALLTMDYIVRYAGGSADRAPASGPAA